MPVTPKKSDEYHVFLASPTEMKAERQAVHDFFEHYNLGADSRGLRFTVVGWEKYVTAGVGRPQALITEQTLVRYQASLVLFVGILGKEFGSPTGTHESGTEEEFEWALRMHREHGFPQIKLFFRRPKHQGKSSLPPNRVDQFRQQLNNDIYYRSFANTNKFRDLVQQDLFKWLSEFERSRPWNSASVPAALPPAERERLLTDYLHTLIRKTQELPLHGLYSPKGEQLRVPLERVFVSLKAAPTPPADKEGEATPAQHRKDQRQRLDAGEGETAALTMEATLQKHRHLVILGSPGSGKTTLSQYVALCYARDCVPGATSTWVRDRLQLEERGAVPLLFLLRDVGKHLKAHAPVDDGTEGAARLLEFFHLALKENHHPLLEQFFEKDLQSGQAVVVLDGMDELGDRELRRRVARMIENFALAYPLCRIIVTSRIVGYDEARVGGDFTPTTISNFSEDDVRLFLQQWHRHVAELDHGGPSADVQRKAQENTDGLLCAINANERLGELAVNPLILTVIALLHRENVTLPERRVELYAKVVELLLGRRDEQRGIESSTVFEQRLFGIPERREAFQAIALDMHTRAAKEIDLGDLKALLTTDFRRRITDSGVVERAVEWFLLSVLERTGLLVDAGNKSFSFAHLSFQEYLVAKSLEGSDDYEAKTLQRLDDPFWREAILLEFGCHESQSRRNRLLRAIANAPVALGNGNPLHNVVLAADCLHDAGVGQVDVEVLAEVRQRLHDVMAEPLPEVDEARLEGKAVQEERRAFALRRVTAARGLGRIVGEVRSPQEALALESRYWSLPGGEPEWVTIPEGEFVMGSEEDDDEKPVQRVFVSEFRMAWTPVTNAQYWLYVHEKKVDPPSYWSGGQPPREQLTCPVVEVSWADAQGYCTWLAEKSGKAVRLPTEAEWEKAARGVHDARRYLWGNRFDVAKCNSWELSASEGTRGPTPVGLFPEGRSPYGCLDMSGNVWEWLQDWYGARYYQQSPRYDPKGPKSGTFRVLRGGSWRDAAPYLRVSRRGHDDPGLRFVYVGFRCAV